MKTAKFVDTCLKYAVGVALVPVGIACSVIGAGAIVAAWAYGSVAKLISDSISVDN